MLLSLLNDALWSLPSSTSLSFGARLGLHPDCDIEEREDGIYLHLDVPGVPREDISVTLKDGVVAIEGKRSISGGKFLRAERASGDFHRAFKLSGDYSDAVEAELRDGVLTVFVKKSAAAAPVKVEIK